jgi:predicted ATPase/DNA-binding CsgD family transcriptional regulator
LRDSLVDALRPRQLLIVLDNCEHLVQACAELVDVLLRACPDVRVLATSRQSLHVSGETTWRVPSLTLPPSEDRTLAETFADYDATRLFVERAAAALPSFAISVQNEAAICRVCQRLDGIPLAIELAAARVAALGVDQIDERLSDRFRLLTGGSRVALPRQQTLRAALDWSLDLLSEEERVIFRRLAVFAGGFTLEAAETVCSVGVREEPVDTAIDVLGGLVDKSLVIADVTVGSVRYRLLETMREYGWEKLRLAGEEPVIRDRHRDWFLAQAEEADAEIRSSKQESWLIHLEREHDNLRAVLTWCLGIRRDGESGLRLAGSLAWFWRLHGHISEGRQWLRLALAMPSSQSVLSRSRALSGDGFLAFAQGDLVTATAHFEESLLLSRGLRDRRTVSWALHGLGRVWHSSGDGERAERALEESLDLFRDLGDTAGCAYSLFFLARQARVRGDLVRATDLYGEAMLQAQAIGDTWLLGWVVAYRADLAFRQGDFGEAAALARQGLALLYQIRATWGVGACLEILCSLAGARGELERAARLSGAEEAIRTRLGTASQNLDTVTYQQGVAAVLGALGARRFTALVAEGRAMDLDDVVTYALTEDEVPANLPRRIGIRPTSRSSVTLTRREREVAALIARGFHNRDIAVALTITPRTVDTHVMNVLTKLELHTRAQIAVWAVEHGLTAKDT